MADGIIFRTTDMLRWGAAGGSGTGGNLTPTQFDENNWEFLTRIQALENNPPEAVNIVGFTVIGSQFEVNMSDGSTLGPYDLPIATFRFAGEWINGLPLLQLDLVQKAGYGLYLVRIAHTTPDSPATFDPNAVDEDSGSPTFGQPLYQLVYGEQEYIYDIGFFYPGRVGTGVDDGYGIAGHQFVHAVTMPADLEDSRAYLTVDPAADMEFIIQKNEVAIGSVNFTAGQNNGTFDFPDDVEFAVGDRIRVMKPTAGVDTDARELYLTFFGVRSF